MIPFIPRSAPEIQGPTAPAGPNLEGYPKRSICLHCQDPISQEVEDGDWGSPNLLGGANSECHKAPNPDEGPMPGHAPGSVLHPPKKT